MEKVDYKVGTKAIIADFKGEVPEGKRFHAWNTREDGTGIMYYPGTEVLMVDTISLWPVFVDAVQEVSE